MASPVSATDRPDTDPGVGGGSANWSGPTSDGAPTAAWAVEQTRGWATQQQPAPTWAGQEASPAAWSAQDPPTTAWTAQEPAAATWTAEETPTAWSAQEPPTTPWAAEEPAATTWAAQEPPKSDWGAEDPLTSPSFSVQAGYAEDGRSYRGSHDRAQAQRDHSGNLFTSPANGRLADKTTPLNAASDYQPNGSGSSYDYQPAPAWEAASQPAPAPSYDDPYGSYSDGWSGARDDYPNGQLEPLPGPGDSSSEPTGSWHSAPIPAGDPQSYAEPPARSGDRAAFRYDDSPLHQEGSASQDAGYRQQDTYANPGYQGWQGTEPDYGQTPDYDAGVGADAGAGQEYGQPGGYDLDHPSHSNPTGYDQPGYGPGPGETGYGQAAYDQGATDNGYGQPAYHSGATDNGYGQPAYDPGATDTDHSQEAGYGQEPGFGHYPGYDGGRR